MFQSHSLSLSTSPFWMSDSHRKPESNAQRMNKIAKKIHKNVACSYDEFFWSLKCLACDKMIKNHAIFFRFKISRLNSEHFSIFIQTRKNGMENRFHEISLKFSLLFDFQAFRQRVISHRAIRITWAVIYHHNRALRLTNRYSFKNTPCLLLSSTSNLVHLLSFHL